DNIPNNQNGWIEEDAEEKEEDPEEDPKKDSEEEPEDYDDDMEMDHEAEVIDPYMDDGSNNPPPPNSKEEETHPTSPVIPDVDDFSGLKKLVKGLSDRFDEYERSKDFDANKVLEKELVNERNGKEFYREFATFGIDDDDDDTAPMDSQPHETMPPRKSTRGNPPPSLTQDTVNRMIQESVEAAIRAKRERVQNEANCAEGPNVAPVARECTFADFIKCSPITFRGNEGA
nr:hypothetical protein [Tanacetum cinerariifolium]